MSEMRWCGFSDLFEAVDARAGASGFTTGVQPYGSSVGAGARDESGYGVHGHVRWSTVDSR